MRTLNETSLGIELLLDPGPGEKPLARMEKSIGDRFANSFVFFFWAAYPVSFAEVPDQDDWGVRGVGHEKKSFRHE